MTPTTGTSGENGDSSMFVGPGVGTAVGIMGEMDVTDTPVTALQSGLG